MHMPISQRMMILLAAAGYSAELKARIFFDFTESIAREILIYAGYTQKETGLGDYEYRRDFVCKLVDGGEITMFGWDIVPECEAEGFFPGELLLYEFELVHRPGRSKGIESSLRYTLCFGPDSVVLKNEPCSDRPKASYYEATPLVVGWLTDKATRICGQTIGSEILERAIVGVETKDAAVTV
jgi:hypothetical protein